ncbi:MAG: NifU family protein [Planctomycetes bacterium]|nr:NifU family protein [Planctomycetota bacterium]
MGAESAEPPRGDTEQVRVAQSVLDEIAPFVRADGGEITLVAVEDGWVLVRLRGACAHCSAADATLFQALEPKLRAVAPWLRGVRAV